MRYAVAASLTKQTRTGIEVSVRLRIEPDAASEDEAIGKMMKVLMDTEPDRHLANIVALPTDGKPKAED